MSLKEDLLKKFPNILDSKNRVNANINRFKNVNEISSYVNEIINNKDIINHYSLSEKINFILNNTDLSKCYCEVCKSLTKYIKSQNRFQTFCSFKCSRTPKSSTFIKAQKTCLKKYGVKSNLVTKENIDNIIKKYGGIGMGSEHIRKKIKRTVLNRYNVENVFQNDIIKNKIKETHNKKYGGNYHTVKLGNKIKLLEDKKYCEELASRYCMSTICEMLGIASNTLYKYFEKHNIKSFNRQRSNGEIEIVNFIKSLGIDNIILGDRQQIKPYEIDIFLPDYNLGIEYNGLYWHSELFGCKPTYHVNKLKMAISKNINLIQIFENEWILKQDIVKSKISSILNKNKKIYSRKCIIKELTNNIKMNFINDNHIQGDAASSINYGLYYDDMLVSAMTFAKSRFDKNYDYELVRFCNIKYTNVIGGFSKLLNHFRKTYNSPSIISFADRRYSNGNVYLKNGFTFISNTKPSYHYFKTSSIILENRIKFQKHKLEKQLPLFDNNLSEWENMKLNNYNRIWDCGNSKWALK
jgi:hypothetical protein